MSTLLFFIRSRKIDLKLSVPIIQRLLSLKMLFIYNLNFLFPLLPTSHLKLFLSKAYNFLYMLAITQHASQFSHYCYWKNAFICIYFFKFPLSVDHLYDCNSVRPSLEIDLDWFRTLDFLVCYILYYTMGVNLLISWKTNKDWYDLRGLFRTQLKI